MAGSAGIFWLLLLVSPLASAEIFKCVARTGLDLYQNFPCQFDSMGWVPTPPLSQRSGQPKSHTRADAEAAASRSGSSLSALRPGMTTEEVRAMWGEPANSHWEEPGEGDRFEVWLYGNGRSVRFVNGRVSAVPQ